MQANWRIGSIWGIPLYVDSSWFFIMILLTISNGSELSQDGEQLLGWLFGLIMAFSLFASILLHELGHSLVAKSQGIPVKSINLFLLGGFASLEQESKTPSSAFQVAVAGPAVSILVAVSFWLVSQGAQEFSLAYKLTSHVANINLIWGLFNLIPALPLDGGQLLKAAVWKFTGSRLTGIRWAASIGKALGYMGVAFGLLGLILANNFSCLLVALLGWFILRSANAHERLASLQESLLEIKAAAVMSREFRVVNAKLTLQDFAQEYVRASEHNLKPYYAASDGRYRGLLSIQDLQAAERSTWENKTLEEIVHPLTEIPSVSETANLLEVIHRLEERNLNRITVLSPAGTVAGVIDKGDLVAAIAAKNNLFIPPGEIKRIKAEGTYPPGLQLLVITKMMAD